MLKLNEKGKENAINQKWNLNTSYVKVKHNIRVSNYTFFTYLNTSYVKVKLC